MYTPFRTSPDGFSSDLHEANRKTAPARANVVLSFIPSTLLFDFMFKNSRIDSQLWAGHESSPTLFVDSLIPPLLIKYITYNITSLSRVISTIKIPSLLLASLALSGQGACQDKGGVRQKEGK